VLDYLLTRESSYFDSAQRAPKTRASNLMVPNRSEDGDGEGVPIGSNVVVDGFEDKDLTEYNDVEAATVTATTSYDGDSAVVITDRNEEMLATESDVTLLMDALIILQVPSVSVRDHIMISDCTGVTRLAKK
jgi:hypothetical protein